jgi:BolA family transcriptional regulator, general stress-responsive regulator
VSSNCRLTTTAPCFKSRHNQSSPLPAFARFLAVAALTNGSGTRYADAMARRDVIAEKLTKAFAPARLDVVDESHQHAGHAGHRDGGETHFRVHIVAAAFRGKNRLERHRMINETLVGELEGGVHALAIHASAPGEGGA